VEKATFWQRPERLLLLRGWARDGVSEREIARRMGLRPLGLRIWKGRYPAIAEALSRTGEMADYQVEEALLRAATGYRYTEEKREETEKGEKLVVSEKEATPNVTAIGMWLKRRKPEIWDESLTDDRPSAENNLFQALGDWEEEVIAPDEIPNLQPKTEADNDLVEAGAI